MKDGWVVVKVQLAPQYIEVTVRPYSFSLALVHSIPSWLVGAEIECTVHAALPKRPIDQFKPVQ